MHAISHKIDQSQNFNFLTLIILQMTKMYCELHLPNIKALIIKLSQKSRPIYQSEAPYIFIRISLWLKTITH